MRIALNPSHLMKVKEDTTSKALRGLWKELSNVVNHHIYFGSPADQAIGNTGNLDGVWPGTLNLGYTILTPGANIEFTVIHNLGRVPVGYDIKSIDQPAVVYDSRKNAWTTTEMYLKCNLAGVNLVLFVH